MELTWIKGWRCAWWVLLPGRVPPCGGADEDRVASQVSVAMGPVDLLSTQYFRPWALKSNAAGFEVWLNQSAPPLNSRVTLVKFLNFSEPQEFSILTVLLRYVLLQ